MARRNAAWVGERGVTRRLSVRIRTSSLGKPIGVAGAVQDHAQRRVDLAAVELQAAFEPAIEVLQHRAGRLDRARLAGDRDQVAARREARRDLLLDQRQMLVMLAEQQGAEPVVVEAEGPGVDVGGERRDRFQAHAAQPRAASGSIGTAARLWAWLAVIRTSITSPRRAPGALTWTAWR